MKKKIPNLKNYPWESTFVVALISVIFLSIPLNSFFFESFFTILLGVYALYKGIKMRRFYFQVYSLFFLGMFLLRFFPFVFGNHLHYSDVEQAQSFLIFPLIFSLIKIDEKQWKQLQWIVIFGFSAYLLWILGNYYVEIYRNGNLLESFRNAKSYSHLFLGGWILGHPSFLAMIFLLSVPMAMTFLSKEKKLGKQIFLVLFLIVLIFIILVTGSRIGLFVFAALISLGIVFYYRKYGYFLKSLFALVFVCILLFCSRSEVQYEKDPIREEMKAFGISKIKENPIFGYGAFSQHASFCESHTASFENTQIQTLGHFHNAYMDEVFQYGLLGSLFFFSLLIYLSYLALKKRDFYLLSFLAAYLLFFYVETPFGGSKGIIPMMLWISLIMNTQEMRLPKK